jgi:hypothetical protein
VHACRALPDCKETPWVHLAVPRARLRQAKALDVQGKGFHRAISFPFFEDLVLSVEVKWAGFDDTIFHVVPFAAIVELYGMDEPFLEMVSFWFHRKTQIFPREMRGMEKHLKRLPVPYPALPYPHPTPGTQNFTLGDMVAVRADWKKKIPRGLFEHHLFVITKHPEVYFCVQGQKEPLWAQLRPCDRQGEPLRGSEPFPIGLTWLRRSLRISEDADADRRTRKLLDYLLNQESAHMYKQQLQVTLPYPALTLPYPTLPYPTLPYPTLPYPPR